MEDKNNNYNTRHSGSLNNRETKSGWVILGVVALLAVLGIAFYKNNDRNDLGEISPAAGTSTDGTNTPNRGIDGR